MAWTQEQINEIYMKIQQLAATDEEFRAELLKDSSAAIEKIAGQPLPDDFKVKVIENDPQYAATFVLPSMLPEELEEDDLEQVAGGVCSMNIQRGAGGRGINPEFSDANCSAKISK